MKTILSHCTFTKKCFIVKVIFSLLHLLHVDVDQQLDKHINQSECTRFFLQNVTSQRSTLVVRSTFTNDYSRNPLLFLLKLNILEKEKMIIWQKYIWKNGSYKSPNSAYCYHNIGFLTFVIGNHSKAFWFCECIIEVDRHSLSLDHPQLLL